jgi:hypothetical protein
MINRRKIKSFIKKQARNKMNLLLIFALFSFLGLACNFDTKANDKTSLDSRQQIETNNAENKPKKLDSYTVRGFKFSYYLVPKNLTHEELITAANEIHTQEPESHLILVDEEAGLSEYVNYAKEISKGNKDVTFPKEWANEHIVGNVQKYLSGRWMLCEGNGYREIAEIK